jgi:adenylate cyclase
VPLLPGIRFGTERYPEKVARRLRALNITTWIASATHAFYAVVLVFDFTRFWWLAIGNTVAMLLYAGIPMLHRFGHLAAPIVIIVLYYADMLGYICLLGTGIGIQFYFLFGVALAVLYLGPDYTALATAAGVVAAALIIAVQLTVPFDTGLLPQWLIVASLVTNTVVNCGALLLIVSYALGEAARAETAAEREYERSERLLTNILPSPIAARLKNESNVVIADRHDEASVLFADMEGFTAQASDTAPDDLVRFLNRVFSDFDRLVDRHGLEKIETAKEWRDPRGRSVPVRMGISSGPVVAGVVATRKFFYDVWGDAVNVAARMETTGVAGKIQISQSVYERLKDQFVLEARGEIEVKGKGSMQTWFLVGRKPLADA